MDIIPQTVLPPSPVAPALATGGSIQSIETIPTHPNPRLKLERLPEEMLLQIFQAVHDTPIPQFGHMDIAPWPWDKDLAWDQGTRGIQNIRLTCREFNRIGSEFLIRFVGVSLSEESLARFRAIMGHPTIGKGVSMVRIRLSVYEEYLYKSHHKFAVNVKRSLHWIAFIARNTNPEVARLAGQYATTMSSADGIPNDKFLEAVEPGWQEYRRRYRAQQNLRKEQFVEDLIKALVTRNTKRELRLEISDISDFRPAHMRSMSLATADNLLDLVSMPQPIEWDTANIHSVVPCDLAWMLPLIVKAFVGDRIRIVDLHFDITSMKTSQQLVFTQVDKDSFREAMRNLRSFTVIRQSLAFYRDQPDLISVFYDCLPSASLRNLRLESVRLRPCRLPNLSWISLKCVNFDFKSLALLLQPLEPRMVAIDLVLCTIALDSQGSWADVFDLLRSKQCWIRLCAPRGKEFDGPFDLIDFNWQDTHWFNSQRYRSLVSLGEQYVHGSYDINPVREQQE